ncbi:hypothetical protein PASE110613_09195 [Paenibacillus sediminis]|uniref:DNA-binding phage protein n=1 Tax=Paenibacillus sediminis TaxID=664909 RepID=A0ABS4H6M9_9BACL|nr:hypothetical protein [Paenibacillus sediminis]MBP1938177.1 DNA-binding phage protein [Paenibacillus sediminis]
MYKQVLFNAIVRGGKEARRAIFTEVTNLKVSGYTEADEFFKEFDLEMRYHVPENIVSDWDEHLLFHKITTKLNELTTNILATYNNDEYSVYAAIDDDKDDYRFILDSEKLEQTLSNLSELNAGVTIDQIIDALVVIDESKVKQKYYNLTSFAEALGISKQALYDRFKRSQNPNSRTDFPDPDFYAQANGKAPMWSKERVQVQQYINKHKK